MSPDSGSKRVLVVDDDAHIREVVRFALEKEGYGTVEAANGREAIERFEAHHPDLIVLDILMPEMDGTEVCRRLRAEHRPERDPAPHRRLRGRYGVRFGRSHRRPRLPGDVPGRRPGPGRRTDRGAGDDRCLRGLHARLGLAL